MAWVVGFLNEDVKASLDALPLDIRASFQRISELIQAHGLERVREPYVSILQFRGHTVSGTDELTPVVLSCKIGFSLLGQGLPRESHCSTLNLLNLSYMRNSAGRMHA
jgi:hypothetical protein